MSEQGVCKAVADFGLHAERQCPLSAMPGSDFCSKHQKQRHDLDDQYVRVPSPVMRNTQARFKPEMLSDGEAKSPLPPKTPGNQPATRHDTKTSSNKSIEKSVLDTPVATKGADTRALKTPPPVLRLSPQKQQEPPASPIAKPTKTIGVLALTPAKPQEPPTPRSSKTPDTTTTDQNSTHGKSKLQLSTPELLQEPPIPRYERAPSPEVRPQALRHTMPPQTLDFSQQQQRPQPTSPLSAAGMQHHESHLLQQQLLLQLQKQLQALTQVQSQLPQHSQSPGTMPQQLQSQPHQYDYHRLQQQQWQLQGRLQPQPQPTLDGSSLTWAPTSNPALCWNQQNTGRQGESQCHTCPCQGNATTCTTAQQCPCHKCQHVTYTPQSHQQSMAPPTPQQQHPHHAPGGPPTPYHEVDLLQKPQLPPLHLQQGPQWVQQLEGGNRHVASSPSGTPLLMVDEAGKSTVWYSNPIYAAGLPRPPGVAWAAPNGCNSGIGPFAPPSSSCSNCFGCSKRLGMCTVRGAPFMWALAVVVITIIAPLIAVAIVLGTK